MSTRSLVIFNNNGGRFTVTASVIWRGTTPTFRIYVPAAVLHADRLNAPSSTLTGDTWAAVVHMLEELGWRIVNQPGE